MPRRRRTGLRKSSGLRRDLGGVQSRKVHELSDGDTLLMADSLYRLETRHREIVGGTRSMAKSLAFMVKNGELSFVTKYGKCEYEWSGAAKVLTALSGNRLPGTANSIIRRFFGLAKHGKKKIYCTKKQRDCLLGTLEWREKHLRQNPESA